MPYRLTSVACLVCAALSGCSSSAPGTMTAEADAPSQDYQGWAQTAPVTTVLGGAMIQTRENPDTITVAPSAGTLNGASRALTLNDGTYVFRDPDGPAVNGLWTDGLSVLIITPANGFSTNYDFVRVYNQSYVRRAVPYAVEGVIGVVTQAADMPLTGTARYVGQAEGSFDDGTTVFDLDGGSAAVTANFAAGVVHVDMQGFRAVSRQTGRAASVGFDGVRITGAAQAGNRFDGGVVQTTAGSAVVDRTGTTVQSDVIGRFFGNDTAGNPDEVGGVSYLKGTTGSVSTVFIAD